MVNQYFNKYLKKVNNGKKIKHIILMFYRNQFLGNLKNLFTVLLIVNVFYFSAFFLSFFNFINYDITTFKIGHFRLPLFICFYSFWCVILYGANSSNCDTYSIGKVSSSSILTDSDLEKNTFSFLNLISFQAIIIVSFCVLLNYMIYDSNQDISKVPIIYFNLFTLSLFLLIFLCKINSFRFFKKQLSVLGLSYENETLNAINLFNYYDKKYKEDLNLIPRLNDIKLKMWSTKEELEKFLEVCLNDKYFDELEVYSKFRCEKELERIKLEFENKDNLKFEDKIKQEIEKMS